jgi:hypothetical protein
MLNEGIASGVILQMDGVTVVAWLPRGYQYMDARRLSGNNKGEEEGKGSE